MKNIKNFNDIKDYFQTIIDIQTNSFHLTGSQFAKWNDKETLINFIKEKNKLYFIKNLLKDFKNVIKNNHYSFNQYLFRLCQSLLFLKQYNENLKYYSLVEITNFLLKDINEKTNFIDIKNNNGDTLLHLFIKKIEPRIVEKLIKLGADYNIKNVNNATPLQLITILNFPINKKLLESSHDEGTGNSISSEDISKINSIELQNNQPLTSEYKQTSQIYSDI